MTNIDHIDDEETEMSVTLLTVQGLFVADVEVEPPFNAMPGVIIWGERCFIRDRVFPQDSTTRRFRYVEALVWYAPCAKDDAP